LPRDGHRDYDGCMKSNKDIQKRVGTVETFSIRVTPKASKRHVEIEDLPDGQWRLRVYVTCVPEDGKANQAVRECLAKTLDVPVSSITIIQGEHHRDKVVQLAHKPRLR